MPKFELGPFDPDSFEFQDFADDESVYNSIAEGWVDFDDVHDEIIAAYGDYYGEMMFAEWWADFESWYENG